MLGCFLLTGGYIERDVLEKRFESRATAAIDDASQHCDMAADSDDPWEVAQLALELEAIARAHGLISEVQANDTHAKRQHAAQADAEKAKGRCGCGPHDLPILTDADRTRTPGDRGEARSGMSDRKGASDIADEESTDQLLRCQAPTSSFPPVRAGSSSWGRYRPLSPVFPTRAPRR